MRLQGANAQLMPPDIARAMRQRFAAGAGVFPLVGTADTVAERLEVLSAAGVDGALLTWVDYDAGIADFTRDVERAARRARRIRVLPTLDESVDELVRSICGPELGPHLVLKATLDELRAIARDEGLVTLREAAWQAASDGVTSIA